MNNNSDQPNTNPDYISFLMRLWKTQSGENHVWRVTLESPLTQEMHRFENLQSLFAFLLAQTEHGTERDGPNRENSPTVV